MHCAGGRCRWRDGGEHYLNDYCWVYICRDGLISQIRNFTDTLHADRLFGLDNKTPTAS